LAARNDEATSWSESRAFILPPRRCTLRPHKENDMSRCVHCDDIVARDLELAHDKIRNQNVHMTGNPNSGSLESEDKGGDIQGYAWY
jgi:hypothetical protein